MYIFSYRSFFISFYGMQHGGKVESFRNTSICSVDTMSANQNICVHKECWCFVPKLKKKKNTLYVAYHFFVPLLTLPVGLLTVCDESNSSCWVKCVGERIFCPWRVLIYVLISWGTHMRTEAINPYPVQDIADLLTQALVCWQKIKGLSFPRKFPISVMPFYCIV